MFRRKHQSPTEAPPELKPLNLPTDIPPAAEPDNNDEMSAPPLKPFTRSGAHLPAAPLSGKASANVAFRPEISRRTPDIPGLQRKSPESEGKRLTVGKEISLSGEITSCDKLIVEGTVEATLTSAKIIEIAETGLFKGSATVEEADIDGRFEGSLTVFKKLTIKSKGKVSGTIRYGSLMVEVGGEIFGNVEVIREKPQPLALTAIE